MVMMVRIAGMAMRSSSHSMNQTRSCEHQQGTLGQVQTLAKAHCRLGLTLLCA